MSDGPDEWRLPAEPVSGSGNELAIEIAVEIAPEWVVGDQEAQHDDGTQRQPGTNSSISPGRSCPSDSGNGP